MKNGEMVSQQAAIARAYFAHHRVRRYRMKKISEMSDAQVVECCHWWQEENGMVMNYRAFAERYFPDEE